jgi:hypothetical protein
MYIYVYKQEHVFCFFCLVPISTKFGLILEDLRGYVSDPLKPQNF